MPSEIGSSQKKLSSGLSVTDILAKEVNPNYGRGFDCNWRQIPKET